MNVRKCRACSIDLGFSRPKDLILQASLISSAVLVVAAICDGVLLPANL